MTLQEKQKFQEWLKIQPLSITHIRDVLTMKSYIYKSIQELYELFIQDQKKL